MTEDHPRPSAYARLRTLRYAIAEAMASMASFPEEDPAGNEVMGALRRLDRALAVPANEDDPQLLNWLASTADSVLNLTKTLNREAPHMEVRARARAIADDLDGRTRQRVAQISALAKRQPSPLAEEWLVAARQLELETNEAEAERHLSSLRTSATEARDVVQDTKQAAGQVADVKLGEAYETYQRAEESTANGFRWAAVATLLVAAGVSVIGAYVNPPKTAPSAITHIAVVISVLALFGYLAREAAQHRNTARWAAVMVVQLRTFDSYTADMSGSEREALRANFGRRVFAELPGGASGHGEQGELSLPTLQALLDIIKATQK